jgi:hypothetical protein
VTYVYDGKTETLPPTDSRVHSVTLAVHDPSPVTYNPSLVHPKSVIMERSDWDYKFVDSPFFPVKIKNELNRLATLSLDEWMEPDSIDDITAGYETTTGNNKEGTIYTATPVFTVTTPTFLARAIWVIKPDDSNSGAMTCFVTICEYD